jgi:hypothetical protein
LFGEPTSADEYKVSTEWRLKDENGQVFAVYDWKETNLYGDGLPSPEKFREENRLMDWHIGGHRNTGHEKLIEYIEGSIK